MATAGGLQLVRKVKLIVPSANAKPGPAIGQALGPLGLNMADFCKQFNDRTKDYDKDIPLPVTLSAFSNRKFTFVVKSPHTSWLLKKCAGIEKGASRPGHEVVGKVHVKQIYEIAQLKLKDAHLKKVNLQAFCRCIVGSTKSMGLEIVNTVVQQTKKGTTPTTETKTKAGDKGKKDSGKKEDKASGVDTKKKK